MRVMKPAPMIGKVREDLDRLFDRFLGGTLFTEPFAPTFPIEPMAITWTPLFDLIETEKEYLVRLEVPGIYKENLDINLTGNVLTITGRRDAVQEGKGETYLWQEREFGKFARTVRLPAPVLENKVEATYQEGILTVHLPKVTPAVANKILIK